MSMEPLWRIDEVVAATGGRLIGTPPGDIDAVHIDSREVGAGSLFIAIKGDNQDGHKFVVSALANGAVLAIVSHFDDEMCHAGALLVVDDTLKAMEKLGVAGRLRSKAKIIAVTGSVGKTTTKDALALALAPSGKTHFSVASFNNHWGVPLTLARMARDARFAVFEIGMNHAGEIADLVKMVRPDIAIITAIAESHLGHFASIDEICEAKAEIFESVPPSGSAVLNADSPYFGRLCDLAEKAGIKHVVGFGRAPQADVCLKKAVLHNVCSCVNARVFGQEVTFKLGSPGEHVVMNVLSVLAAVKLADADLARAVLALAQLRPPKGRGVRHQLATRDGLFLLIDESYNANPTSMRAALNVLGRAEPLGAGRRIAVLGDMLELGDDAISLHESLAQPIEEAHVDKVYACGDMMRALWQKLPGYRRAHWAVTSQELSNLLLDEITAGDVVMVKGSLGSKMGPLVQKIRDRFKEADKAA